jgi:hypothetical protein
MVTGLGNQATVYGAASLKNFKFAGTDIAINPSGTDVTLNNQPQELTFPDGSIELTASNAPVLTVQSFNAPAQVIFTTKPENVEKAILVIAGTEVPRRRNRWIVTRPPGNYTYKLTAEGYEPESGTVTILPGKQTRQDLTLKALPPTVVSVALVITNGTPGAKIELDNKQVGILDQSGNFRTANFLTEGRHTVVITKEGFETHIEPLSVKPPADAILSGIKLQLSKVSLAFETEAKNVTVKYRKEGDSEYKEATAPGKLSVTPGSYEILATSPGYQDFHTTQRVERDGATISLKLVTKSPFEDPSEVVELGDWFKSKNPGKFVSLKTGLVQTNIIFAITGKGLPSLFWDKKKFEWLVEIPQSATQVHYTLEGHKLTRKVEGEGMNSDPQSSKVDAQSPTRKDLISIHVHVEGTTIRITNDKQVKLDECDVSGQNFSKGRIAIRTDQQFVVRSDN